MEIVYSIFIGMISSKIHGMIVGIGLQCRRDSCGLWKLRFGASVERRSRHC